MLSESNPFRIVDEKYSRSGLMYGKENASVTGYDGCVSDLKIGWSIFDNEFCFGKSHVHDGEIDSHDGDCSARDFDKSACDFDKSACDGDRSACDGDKPACDGDKSAHDGDKSARDGESSAHDSESSACEGEYSAYEGDNSVRTVTCSAQVFERNVFCTSTGSVSKMRESYEMIVS